MPEVSASFNSLYSLSEVANFAAPFTKSVSKSFRLRHDFVVEIATNFTARHTTSTETAKAFSLRYAIPANDVVEKDFNLRYRASGDATVFRMIE